MTFSKVDNKPENDDSKTVISISQSTLIKEKLVKLGYERADLIEGKGQFSVRGGIVDIATSIRSGVRIEFWGDEIDSISLFEIENSPKSSISIPLSQTNL